MSTVTVLTPMLIGSWPIIAQAVAGAAVSLGFTIAQSTVEAVDSENLVNERVESEVANSQVALEQMTRGESIRITRAGVMIEFTVEERGRCRICASGKGVGKKQLQAIADEVAGRVVQQFTYHKLVTELKQGRFKLLHESVAADQSIQLQVQLER